MLRKVARSIERRGWAGTASLGLELIRDRWRRPHIAAHLTVPFEMMKNPRHAGAWFRDRFDREPPSRQGLPWIAWPCIDFLEARLKPTHRIFEWGGGGSTLFFLKKGCFVSTVESDRGWLEQIETEVNKLGSEARARWDLRWVPAQGNDDPLIADYVAQIHAGGPWDVVMVDGWSRRRCFYEAHNELNRGGALILDNADQRQYSDIPSTMAGWEHHPFRGLGVARSWTTQTDAYVLVRPAAR
jgi:hypothetical protein